MADVFMSFIHEEERTANNVKSFFPLLLGNSIDTFMSSDQTAIYAGEDWLNRIFEELKNVKVLISMLSPLSVRRPWINFEAGAAWRSAKVIPVCFGGLKIDNLPKPYSSLQAVELDTHDGFHYLMCSVAHYLGLPAPEKPILTECPTHWTDEQKSKNKDLVRKYEVFQMCNRMAMAVSSDSIQTVKPA